MINKINLQQTFDRFLSFYERRLSGGILAAIYPAPVGGGQVDVGETRTRGCLLLEDLEGCRRRVGNQDISEWSSDIIPAVYPTGNFGESIWSGLLGGEIIFSGNNVHTWSHCSKPVIQSVEAFNYPEIKTDNFWFGKMLEVTAYFTSHLPPNCDVNHFIFDDCLNLLVELRGAQNAYTDLYDYPDFVRKFMDWSVRENIRVFDAQAKISRNFVRDAFGGHPVFKYATCNMPEISIDAYNLCRPEVYEEFGLEHHQKLVEHYGGAKLHIHSNGRHLCRLAASNDRITYCSFTEDIGFQKPWEIVAELKESMDPIPIRVTMPKEVFVKKLDERSLPGGVFYLVPGAESVKAANELMRRVFDYHSPNP